MYLGVLFIVWIAAVASQYNYKMLLVAGGVYAFLLTQVLWVPSTRNFSDSLVEIQQQEKKTRVLVSSPFDYLVLKYYLEENRNLFFWDDDGARNMKNSPWLFFDKAHIVDGERLPEDYLI